MHSWLTVGTRTWRMETLDQEQQIDHAEHAWQSANSDLKDHGQDRLDSRDLCDELAALEGTLPDGVTTETPWRDLPADVDTDDLQRIRDIRALFDEITGYAGDRPEDGIFLIREDAWEDYARELAEDCGMIPDGLNWPLTCIDWEQAARELAMDYTTVTFDGADWYYR